MTGTGSLALMRAAEQALSETAELLQATPGEVPAAAERVLARQRALEEELRGLRSTQLGVDAVTLAEEAAANGGVVVARRDDLDPNALRDLALSVRDRPGVRAVGLAGLAGPDRVALVVASKAGSGVDARAVAAEAAKAVGGGGGGSPELATAGGKLAAGIPDALERLRALLAS